ncbi:MAG: bifunctional nicotinamidase/pyrazinamidase [Ottowia sp.]|nr:bifunctional nicotinamidase/pyrazinamidase [Ottowia sp.]
MPQIKTTTKHDCLLIVDMQNDFMPGGPLAVTGGDEIVPIINRMMCYFDCVVCTQDWHPPNHISFAATHPGYQPFESTQLAYGRQTLWPVHCVAGSEGAALHSSLDLRPINLIVRKGYRPSVDSYSAFYEADRVTATGLEGYLHTRQIRRVVCVGLATDYCVAFSALDARAAGFSVALVSEACRAIDLEGSLTEAMRNMNAAGIQQLSINAFA